MKKPHIVTSELWRVGAEIARVRVWSDDSWTLDVLDETGDWFPMIRPPMDDRKIEDVLEVLLCEL